VFLHGAAGGLGDDAAPAEVEVEVAVIDDVTDGVTNGVVAAVDVRVGAEPPPSGAAVVAPTAPEVSALAVRDLSVSFGGIRAVSEVSFDVAPGEIVGLIGPNGAGKTTLLDLISGFVAADGGSLALFGTDLDGAAPSRRARLGLGRSFQDSRLFPSLTVEETIATALERWIDVRDPLNAALRLPAEVDSEVAVAHRVDELVDLLGLGAFRTKFIGELSTGSRRVVDLGCILAHEPSVILLDEPSSGIAQREAEALGPMLRSIQRHLDASLVVIEHDMALISSVSDRLIALDQGRVVRIGEPDEVLNDPVVVESYLGGDAAVLGRSGAVPTSEPHPAGPPYADPRPSGSLP
jgi:branched-chain amino acid transport system ATP-binding protein